VFWRPEAGNWRLGARGQIEGIGTSPRLSAKDAEGGSLAVQKLGEEVRDGRDALDGLCMGTRPGMIDPGVILHLFQTVRLSASWSMNAGGCCTST